MTLRDCFDSHTGRLIGKIDHFFDDYEVHLQRFRNTAVRLLEIGVHGGGSLELWRRYFGQQATIHGVDIDPAAADKAPPDCPVHIGSQADPSFLRSVLMDHGPFDILIDDGSHLMPDQIATFDIAYPLLAPGGIYICEDAFTSYWREYGGGTDRPDTFIAFAKQRVDDLHAFWRLDDAVQPSAFSLSTRSIHFYSGAVVFERQTVAAPVYTVRHGEQRNVI
ncbi:MAG: class I SAM-dependent methyltransferase, partial [Haliea sp.]